MSRRGDDLLFRGFADERRLRILHLLQGGEMCVGDLVAVLDLPQSTVSRQLGILRGAGLVSVREEGLWRHYGLTEPTSPLHAHLVECLDTCFGHVPSLREDARKAEALADAGGCCPPTAQTSETADSGRADRTSAPK